MVLNKEGWNIIYIKEIESKILDSCIDNKVVLSKAQINKLIELSKETILSFHYDSGKEVNFKILSMAIKDYLNLNKFLNHINTKSIKTNGFKATFSNGRDSFKPVSHNISIDLIEFLEKKKQFIEDYLTYHGITTEINKLESELKKFSLKNVKASKDTAKYINDFLSLTSKFKGIKDTIKEGKLYSNKQLRLIYDILDAIQVIKHSQDRDLPSGKESYLLTTLKMMKR